MSIFENLPRPEQTTYHANNSLNLFMTAVRDAILFDKLNLMIIINLIRLTISMK